MHAQLDLSSRALTLSFGLESSSTSVIANMEGLVVLFFQGFSVHLFSKPQNVMCLIRHFFRIVPLYSLKKEKLMTILLST